MTRIFPLCILAVIVLHSHAIAQADVLDPSDKVVTYDPQHPPALPADNKISKWVRTKIYNWNTDNFKCYYFNGMAFRLRYPTGYNPADRSRKYPVIVFYHGGGEVAPNTDNETQLYYSAPKLEAMADQGQFNAFLLYPVMSSSGIWEDTHFANVNKMLDSLQKYHAIDPDRILTLGFSMGGFASIRYSAWYPQRSCLSVSSSPALIETLSDADKNRLVTIPMWMGNGGLDVNPIPLYVQNFLSYMTAKGSVIKQSFYPLEGHTMWLQQYEEPYLLPLLQGSHKANPVVYFGRTQFDQPSSISARLALTPGFYAYEWQKDNATVATSTNGSNTVSDNSVYNFTGSEVSVSTYGTYRARFKRTASSGWSDWSPNPVVIYKNMDKTAPTAPANLKTGFAARTFTELLWDKSSDNGEVAKYDVYVNGTYTNSTTNTSITIDNLTPNTAYTYAVKAIDKGNNASPFSNTVTATSTADGLYYKYYKGNWPVLPDFSILAPSASGTSPNVDINIRPSGEENNYGFSWQGYITIRTPGTYTFETFSDDGSRVFFNTLTPSSSNILVNNDGEHSAEAVSGTVTNLAAGVYPITITYFQKLLGATMQLYWTGPGIPRQLVPDAAFNETYQDKTAPSVPGKLKASFVSRNSVDLVWEQSTDNLGVAKYNIYADNVFKLTTTATTATVDGLSAGVNHYFEVKALDQAGNASAAASLSAITATSGLRYKYYEGSWSALPDFSALTPVSTGTAANVNLNMRRINDNFGVVWEGYINIKTPGTYTFETVSDDGSKLYFNSLYLPRAATLVNNDGEHPAKSVSNSVYIGSAGVYPIAITFYEKEGGESMQVYWQGPGISRQLIPDVAFTDASSSETSMDESESAANSILVREGATLDKEKMLIGNPYPNPFSKDLRFIFYNTAPNNNISVGIYDLSGKLVYNRQFGKVAVGATTLSLSLGGQPQLVAGTYIAQLQVNGLPVKTWKLTKTKK